MKLMRSIRALLTGKAFSLAALRALALVGTIGFAALEAEAATYYWAPNYDSTNKKYSGAGKWGTASDWSTTDPASSKTPATAIPTGSDVVYFKGARSAETVCDLGGTTRSIGSTSGIDVFAVYQSAPNDFTVTLKNGTFGVTHSGTGTHGPRSFYLKGNTTFDNIDFGSAKYNIAIGTEEGSPIVTVQNCTKVQKSVHLNFFNFSSDLTRELTLKFKDSVVGFGDLVASGSYAPNNHVQLDNARVSLSSIGKSSGTSTYDAKNKLQFSVKLGANNNSSAAALEVTDKYNVVSGSTLAIDANDMADGTYQILSAGALTNPGNLAITLKNGSMTIGPSTTVTDIYGQTGHCKNMGSSGDKYYALISPDGRSVVLSITPAAWVYTAMPDSKGYTITGGNLAAQEQVDVYTAAGTTTEWTVPGGVSSIQYLVIGGGGAGGAGAKVGAYNGGGGGGGAGAFKAGTRAVTSSSIMSITVGAGGTAGGGIATASTDVNGKASTLMVGSTAIVTANGGGAGGLVNDTETSRQPNGGSGYGSGGGLGAASLKGLDQEPSYMSGTTSYPGDGNKGGTGVYYGRGSGGGGAGGAGGSPVKDTKAGDGGPGAISFITGVGIYYAGGGGAGSYDSAIAAGGMGGGGAGALLNQTGNPGADGTGSGGGGGDSNSTTVKLGGNGGSGVVIIRYLKIIPADAIMLENGDWGYSYTYCDSVGVWKVVRVYVNNAEVAGIPRKQIYLSVDNDHVRAENLMDAGYRWDVPAEVSEIDYLVVATGAGGGGGSVTAAGSGGNGGEVKTGTMTITDANRVLAVCAHCDHRPGGKQYRSKDHIETEGSSGWQGYLVAGTEAMWGNADFSPSDFNYFADGTNGGAGGGGSAGVDHSTTSEITGVSIVYGKGGVAGGGASKTGYGWGGDGGSPLQVGGASGPGVVIIRYTSPYTMWFVNKDGRNPSQYPEWLNQNTDPVWFKDPDCTQAYHHVSGSAESKCPNAYTDEVCIYPGNPPSSWNQARIGVSSTDKDWMVHGVHIRGFSDEYSTDLRRVSLNYSLGSEDRAVLNIENTYRVRLYAVEFKYDSATTGRGYIDIPVGANLEFNGEVSGHDNTYLKFPAGDTRLDIVDMGHYGPERDHIAKFYLDNFTGGGTGATQTFNISNSVCMFASTTVDSDVAGKLDFNIRLCHDGNNKPNQPDSVLSFGKTLHVNAGSTMTIDATGCAEGVYNILHMENWDADAANLAVTKLIAPDGTEVAISSATPLTGVAKKQIGSTELYYSFNKVTTGRPGTFALTLSSKKDFYWATESASWTGGDYKTQNWKTDALLGTSWGYPVYYPDATDHRAFLLPNNGGTVVVSLKPNDDAGDADRIRTVERLTASNLGGGGVAQVGSGAVKFQNTDTTTPREIGEVMSGVTLFFSGAGTILDGDGEGFFTVRRNAEFRASGFNMSYIVDNYKTNPEMLGIKFDTEDGNGGWLHVQGNDRNYACSSFGWFDGGKVSTAEDPEQRAKETERQRLTVEGANVSFLSTTQSGVAGYLDIELSVAPLLDTPGDPTKEPFNPTNKPMLSFAGPFSVNAGSVLKVDMAGVTTPGTYQLIRAAPFTGTMSLDEIVESGNANLTNKDSSVKKAEVVKVANGIDLVIYNPVAMPTISQTTVTYDGNERKSLVSPASPTGYTYDWEGDWTSAGSHSVTAKLSSGYCWADGSTRDVTLNLTINPNSVAIGNATGTAVNVNWDGTEKTPQITVTLNDGKVLVQGTDFTWWIGGSVSEPTVVQSKKNVGNYLVYFKGIGNYEETGDGHVLAYPWQILSQSYTWNKTSGDKWGTANWTMDPSDYCTEKDWLWPQGAGHVVKISSATPSVTIDLNDTEYALYSLECSANGAVVQNGTLNFSDGQGWQNLVKDRENVTLTFKNVKLCSTNQMSYFCSTTAGSTIVFDDVEFDFTVNEYLRFMNVEGDGFVLKNRDYQFDQYLGFNLDSEEVAHAHNLTIDNATLQTTGIQVSSLQKLNLAFKLGAKNNTETPMFKTTNPSLSVNFNTGSKLKVDVTEVTEPGTYTLIDAASWATGDGKMSPADLATNPTIITSLGMKAVLKTTEKTLSVEVSRLALQTLTLSPSEATYDGNKKSFTPTVTDSDGDTVSSSLLTFKYSVNGGGWKDSLTDAEFTNAGTITVQASSPGMYEGTLTATFTITPKQASELTLTCADSYWWNDEYLAAPVVVKDGDKLLDKGTDYELKRNYSHKSVNETGYTVEVEFKGNYSGTENVTWKILRPVFSFKQTTGDWGAENWTITPTDYALRFPNGAQHVTYVTNAAVANLTVDLKGGSYSIYSLWPNVAPNAVTTLKDGTLTITDSLSIGRLPGLASDSANWKSTLIFEGMTLNNTGAGVAKIVADKHYSTVIYSGNNSLPKNGSGGYMAVAFNSGWNFQTNKFVNGTTTLGGDIVIDYRGPMTGQLWADNAIVVGTGINGLQNDNESYSSFCFIFTLGENNTTTSDAMFQFPNTFAIKDSGNKIIVNAADKPAGTYALMTTPSGATFNYETPTINCKTGYKGTIISSISGSVKEYSLKIEPMTYTVTLKPCNGTGDSGQQVVTATFDASMPTPITKPQRVGYTFNGFYDQMTGGGGQYYTADCTSARNWDKAKDCDLYAQWTAKTYVLTFDKNGGSGGSNGVTATYGEEMPTITPPTRDGFVFDGYYDNLSNKYYKADGTSARTWGRDSINSLTAWWQIAVPAAKDQTWTGTALPIAVTNYSGSSSDWPFELAGDLNGTEPGQYTATATPKLGYCWSDSKIDPKAVEWQILKRDLSGSEIQVKNCYWTGEAITPVLWDSAAKRYLVYGTDFTCAIGSTGASTATDIGTYSVTFTAAGEHYSRSKTTDTWKIQQPSFKWESQASGDWNSANWKSDAIDAGYADKWPQKSKHRAYVTKANADIKLQGQEYPICWLESDAAGVTVEGPGTLDFSGYTDGYLYLVGTENGALTLKDLTMKVKDTNGTYVESTKAGGTVTFDNVTVQNRVDLRYYDCDGDGFAIKNGTYGFGNLYSKDATAARTHKLAIENATVQFTATDCDVGVNHSLSSLALKLGANNTTATAMLSTGNSKALNLRAVSSFTVDASAVTAAGTYPLIRSAGTLTPTAAELAAAAAAALTPPSGFVAEVVANGDKEVDLVVNGTYTITVTGGDGGTGGAAPDYTASVEGSTVTINPLPTKPGYQVKGWTITGAKGGGTVTATTAGVITIPGGVYGNLTLIPTWNASKYTVTLNRKSGSGGSGSVTATYGAAMPSATMPTRTGYEFLGYFDAETDGTQYYSATGESAHVWDKAEAATLYAHWQAKTYHVTSGGVNCSVSVGSTGTFGTALSFVVTPDQDGGKPCEFGDIKIYSGDSASGTLIATIKTKSTTSWTMKGTYYENVYIYATYKKTLFTWVGPDHGEGNWEDSMNWNREGSGIGDSYPKSVSNNHRIKFTPGKYTVCVTNLGEGVAGFIDGSDVDVTFVNYKTRDNWREILVEGDAHQYGKMTVVGNETHGVPALFFAHNGRAYVGGSYTLQNIHVPADKTESYGLPTSKYYTYELPNASIVVTNTYIRRKDDDATKGTSVSFMNENVDMPVSLRVVDSDVALLAVETNHFGRAATLDFERSRFVVGVASDSFGGRMAVEDSLVGLSCASATDTLTLTNVTISGSSTKVGLAANVTSGSGEWTFVMPAGGFQNDDDVINGVETNRVAAEDYAVKDTVEIYTQDVSYSGVAPVAVAGNLDLTAATLTVNASALAEEARDYPLAAVGASGTLQMPTAVTITGCPKGYAAEVKLVDKTMVLSVYKPGLILIFE